MDVMTSPEHRLPKVVQVPSADRLMESAQAERQLGFQQLVRSYLSQMLHGCTNAACTTPTCLSCCSRLSSRPFRPPTRLTACALAHFLASQNDPLRGLCPNPLKLPPSMLDMDGTTRPTAGHDPHKLRNWIGQRRQKKKDAKSLSQNLYDTSAVIFSYSRCIPPPAYLFAASRASRSLSKDSASRQHVAPPPAHEAQAFKDFSSSSAASCANGQAPISAPGAGQAVAQQGLERSHSNPAVSQHTEFTPRSENGFVHKIRHRPLDSAQIGHPPPKTADLTSFDGAGDSPTSPSATMKRRPSLDRHGHTKFDAGVIFPRTIKLINAEAETMDAERRALPVASLLTCEIMEQFKGKDPQISDKHIFYSAPVANNDTHKLVQHTNTFIHRSIFFSLSDPNTLLQSFHEANHATYQSSPLPHLDSAHLTHAFRGWDQPNRELIFDSLWQALEVLFVPPPELATQKSPRLKAAQKVPSLGSTREQTSTMGSFQGPAPRYLNDEDAAHIIMICIHALTSSISVGWPETWVQLRKFRSWGIILPGPPSRAEFSNTFADPWLDIIDELEYEPASRLADRLLRGIGARSTFACILATLNREAGRSEEPDSAAESRLLNLLVKHLVEVERVAFDASKKTRSNMTCRDDPGWTVTATFMEWLRTIIIKKWDGKADVNKWSSVGTAVRIFNIFHAERQSLNLRAHMFYMPYFNERLDPLNAPLEFLTRRARPNEFHLLQFRHFFPPEYLVGYFRTINFNSMFESYARADKLTQLQREFNPFYSQLKYWNRLKDLMKVSISDYLVLEVSRVNALQQTLDQLWRKEQRAFLKPLKVRMGAEGGELGLDQGGVTFEFFRVILDEAFTPSTGKPIEHYCPQFTLTEQGMFTIDPQTRMTWFQPASLGPLWKFELLGRLFSLAVYNGITLPVTFPIALYFNLLAKDHPQQPLQYPTHTSFIRDGWPALTKSFNTLLMWKDGDVSDVFMRSYAFSFDACGRRIDVDVQAFESHPNPRCRIWPAIDEGIDRMSVTEGPFGCTWGPDTLRPELCNLGWQQPNAVKCDDKHVGPEDQELENSPIVPMVTNANRTKFVGDYIRWLTYTSVAPQLLAFRKGFLTCLNEKSLDLFEASSLKALVEGTQNISIPALRANSRYENGYSSDHETIVDFWDVVEDYDMDKRRKLLEFVTASERIPVTGFENMNFSIVKAGPDTEMLPTSSTCFGKLMLPQYKTKEKLKTKLDLAIQNSRGFGVV